MIEPADRAQVVAPPARIPIIDLARGIAVLGILAINVTTMAGPGLAAATPDWHGRAAPQDWAAFTLTWLVFEGKMRTMFATLFGVSLGLFLERGDPGRRLLGQVRRLLWLAVFGYLHFLLLWWGDILFVYALGGMIALLLRDMPPWRLLGLGLALYMAVAVGLMIDVAGPMRAAHAVAAGTATPEQAGWVASYAEAVGAHAAQQFAEYDMGFFQAIGWRLMHHPDFPLSMASQVLMEVFPLMLCGMGLARTGFFAGAWPRRRLVLIAVAGGSLGLAWGAAVLGYAASQGFAPATVAFLPFRFGMPGHIAQATCYFALVALFGGAILRTGMGKRLAAVGRMALSNYIGTTVVMTFVLHRWGLGLAAGLPGQAELMVLMLLGWALMLGWSAPWLARFGTGPLEWLWRKLARTGGR